MRMNIRMSIGMSIRMSIRMMRDHMKVLRRTGIVVGMRGKVHGDAGMGGEEERVGGAGAEVAGVGAVLEVLGGRELGPEGGGAVLDLVPEGVAGEGLVVDAEVGADVDEGVGAEDEGDVALDEALEEGQLQPVGGDEQREHVLGGGEDAGEVGRQAVVGVLGEGGEQGELELGVVGVQRVALEVLLQEVEHGGRPVAAAQRHGRRAVRLVQLQHLG